MVFNKMILEGRTTHVEGPSEVKLSNNGGGALTTDDPAPHPGLIPSDEGAHLKTDLSVY